MMKNNKAFSVLELLLSLLLMSVVLLFVYGAYFQFIHVQNKSSSGAQQFIDTAGGVAQITHDLLNIVHFDFSLSYPKQLSLSGEEQRIFFFRKDQQAIIAIEYTVKSLEDVYQESRDDIFKRFIEHKYQDLLEKKYYVMLRRSANFHDFLNRQQWQKEKIIIPPFLSKESIQWYFFKEAELKKESSWVSSWSESEPPTLVKLKLSLENGGIGRDDVDLIWPISVSQKE